MDEPNDVGAVRDFTNAPSRLAGGLAVLAIALAAIGLRVWDLNGPSLWYDEIVTMRVARAAGPGAIVSELDAIDGTRAPLHPLVLHGWLWAFGDSDLAGRSFSVLCGLATVAVVYLIGRSAFDHQTGLWSAWLTAVCPPLVYYSQEARMYAWLVLLTAVSWLVLLSFRSAAGVGRCAGYGVLLAALAYSHPLGLFMIAAHGVAYLLTRRSLRLTLLRWAVIQAGVVLAILPWLRRYLDHGTDYPMPRYALKYLLAVPIEYIGGNSLVLPVGLAIALFALVRIERDRGDPRHRVIWTHPAEGTILAVWAVVPPTLMFLYSHLRDPIFGPSRYHLYSAPAFLILLAHGLAWLPGLVRWPIAAGALALSLSLWHSYSPTLKADWRGLAAWLDRQPAPAAGDRVSVLVHPSDPRFPREQLEAAHYYLTPRYFVMDEGSFKRPAGPLYEVRCLTRPQGNPEQRAGGRAFYGLIVTGPVGGGSAS